MLHGSECSNWQPERRLIRYIVSGFLMVTLAGVGWVYLIGPTPLKSLLAANGLFALYVGASGAANTFPDCIDYVRVTSMLGARAALRLNSRDTLPRSATTLAPWRPGWHAATHCGHSILDPDPASGRSRNASKPAGSFGDCWRLRRKSMVNTFAHAW